MRAVSDSRARELLDEIRGLVQELEPSSAAVVDLDSDLATDLGFDSLSRVELVCRLERRFACTFPDSVFAEAQTPRDLLRAIQAAEPGQARGPMTTPLPTPVAGGGPVGAPEAAGTLLAVLDWHAERHSERIVIRMADAQASETTLSYGELRRGALAIAAGLRGLEVGRGEPVAIMLPSGPDYFHSFFGILYAGGVPVPLYPPDRLDQIEAYLQRQRTILDNCAARVLIAAEELDKARPLLRTLAPGLRHLPSCAELRARGAALAALPLTLSPADTAFLQYTSGSTANPKGVILSHANLLANLRAMGKVLGFSSDDVFVSWLPLYHDMGLIGAFLGCLYFGATLVLMSPLTFLARPERWLWAVHRYRGTISAAPNFAYDLCVNRLDAAALAGLDLSSWRLLLNGAEPVIPESLERFCTRFAPYGFRREALLPVYGLAENSLGLTFPAPGSGAHLLPVRRDTFAREGRVAPVATADPVLLCISVGRVLPGHELRIVDGQDRELPDGREGQVQFRGPSATSGYYRNAEETRRLFHDDWRDTGDLGFVQENELFLTGRCKDLIIRAGRNLHPQELEAAVATLPGVRKGRVVVFGATDRQAGTERLVVVAETRVRDSAERARLHSAINALACERVGGPADEVVLAAPGSVLKTSSGKLRRAACRSLYEQGRLGRAGGVWWWPLVGLALRGLGQRGQGFLRAGRTWGYGLWAWSLFVGIGLGLVLGVLLLPRREQRWRWVRAGLNLLRRGLRQQLVVRGQTALPPSHCVFVCNHASYIDGLVLASLLPRAAVFVAKSELARVPLLGHLLRRLGVVFVERADPYQAAQDAARLMALHTDLLFFPEGTFTRQPGLRPFHQGAFLAAVKAQSPLVPVALRGTRSVLRDGSWLPRQGLIQVTFGEPISATSAEDDWHAALRLRASSRAFISRYCGEPDLETQPRAA